MILSRFAPWLLIMDSIFKTLNVPALAASLIEGWQKKEQIQARALRKAPIAWKKIKCPVRLVSLIVSGEKIDVEGARASF